MRNHLLTAAALLLASLTARAAPPDLIVHNGKVVTVDANFSVHQAMAVEGGRIVAVGGDADVLATKGPRTVVLDLGGRTVLPGLIDSHVHPSAAAMTEFDHPLGEMESVADVLAYVKARAAALGEGKWVQVSQVFITRLREQRYPTRAELDGAAPKNPVLFSTGPDASLSTLALQLNGIDRDFKVTDGGPGYAEKDPATGEPTGILRGCTRYVKTADREAADRGGPLPPHAGAVPRLQRDRHHVGLRPQRGPGGHQALREDARRRRPPGAHEPLPQRRDDWVTRRHPQQDRRHR
jgi:predicted amidohydrolase YtcJ